HRKSAIKEAGGEGKAKAPSLWDRRGPCPALIVVIRWQGEDLAGIDARRMADEVAIGADDGVVADAAAVVAVGDIPQGIAAPDDRLAGDEAASVTITYRHSAEDANVRPCLTKGDAGLGL